jgi:hypothetical protein
MRSPRPRQVGDDKADTRAQLARAAARQEGHHRVARSFFAWLERRRGIVELAEVGAIDTSIYPDQLYATAREAIGPAKAKSVHEHLSAILLLFD